MDNNTRPRSAEELYRMLRSEELTISELSGSELVILNHYMNLEIERKLARLAELYENKQ